MAKKKRTASQRFRLKEARKKSVDEFISRVGWDLPLQKDKDARFGELLLTPVGTMKDILNGWTDLPWRKVILLNKIYDAYNVISDVECFGEPTKLKTIKNHNKRKQNSSEETSKKLSSMNHQLNKGQKIIMTFEVK